jgi:hypothetical protein
VNIFSLNRAKNFHPRRPGSGDKEPKLLKRKTTRRLTAQPTEKALKDNFVSA